jgi:hypothetical protein
VFFEANLMIKKKEINSRPPYIQPEHPTKPVAETVTAAYASAGVYTMTSSAPQKDDNGNELTPNTLAEIESAFTFNSTLQTSSAGKPQPHTPPATSNPSSTNYLSASSAAGLAAEPPYPDDVPLEHVRSLPSGALSRGTTQAVLQKMDSGTELGRRGGNEGAKRTSAIQVPGSKEGSADGAARKPGFDRTQSWNKEDLKRAMSERLMTGEADENAGYVSKE